MLCNVNFADAEVYSHLDRNLKLDFSVLKLLSGSCLLHANFSLLLADPYTVCHECCHGYTPQLVNSMK